MLIFTVDTSNEREVFVVRIAGELDLFECPRLVRALREAEATHAPWILLDLEGLTFIDAAGLGVLVVAWRRSLADGNRLKVTHGRGGVADLLCLTALDTKLPSVSGEWRPLP
jgi:anti-sigma B factor antagonist